MSEGRHPPDDSEPTHLDSEDLRGGEDSTRPASDGGADAHQTGDELTDRKRIGDFELLSELGRGGMGIVYEARQLSLNRRVALKVLPPGLGLTDTAVKRFEREAQAAAKLHHTNIVPVHAIGEEESCHYYAMELIEGQPLSEVLKDLSGTGSNPLMDKTVTQLGEGEVAEPDMTTSIPSITSLSDSSTGSRKWFDAVAKLISEVADALDYAHGRGVIHRDIKPANLMLSGDGRLCITDFGLARVAQEPGMTVSGSLMGTPAYMSPEQITAGRVKLDHRTDIYSLGAVLYEMLAHQRPFPGESREEILGGILTKDPRPPRRFNPRIPLDLETICLKAMEKDPDRRYATAGEFAEDLRQYLQHGLIKARRANVAQRTVKSIRRHPVAAMAVLAVVLLTAAGTFTWQALSGRKASDIERLVSDARLLLTRGEYREALAATDEVLAAAPDNLDARLIRARLDIHRWHWWEAVEQGREVLAADPDNWEAHLLIAAAAKKGWLHSVSVANHLTAVEGLVPETADAYFLRGFIEVYPGGSNLREGIEWLDRALAQDPGHALALEARNDAHEDLKNFTAAMADAERLIVARPRNAQGHMEKSELLRDGLHDTEGAYRQIERAIELEPENWGAYSSRAAVNKVRGDVDARIADLTRALELDPLVKDSWRARGNAYHAKGEYDLAIADYRQALEINPDDHMAYYGIALAHWRAGRREEARAALDEMSARAESWVQELGVAWLHASWTEYYLGIGDYEKALAEAEKIIEIWPGRIRGYWQRAQVRRATEGEAGIVEDCDLIAALDLDQPEDILERADRMRDFCNRPDEAMKNYDRAIALAPDWADAHRYRGWLNTAQGNIEASIDDFNRAIEIAPHWHEAIFNRGQSYSFLERFEEALADYETVFASGAEGNNGRWALAVAQMRTGREREALETTKLIIDKWPHLANSWTRRAQMFFRLGRVKDAMDAVTRGIERIPQDPSLYGFRAIFASFAEGLCGEIEADIAKQRELAPDDADTWWRESDAHVLGTFFTCPEYYDRSVALSLASNAVEFNSRLPHYRNTLGAALYRNGRYTEAYDALREAAGLYTLENPINLFFLAMTSWRIGNKTDAHSYYGRAVVRMRKTYPRNPAFIRTRKEAAEVLGIED